MKRERKDGNEILNTVLEILIFMLLFAIVLFGLYAKPTYQSTDNPIPTLAENPNISESESEQTEERKTTNTDDSKQTTQKDPDAYYDLNTVTYEQLLTIEQIGESRAEAILAKRDELGRFASTEQLLEIDGIGESTYETISPHFYIG